jgi:hypothetical protein
MTINIEVRWGRRGPIAGGADEVDTADSPNRGAVIG